MTRYAAALALAAATAVVALLAAGVALGIADAVTEQRAVDRHLPPHPIRRK